MRWLAAVVLVAGCGAAGCATGELRSVSPPSGDELAASRRYVGKVVYHFGDVGLPGAPVRHEYELAPGTDKDELEEHLERLLSQRPLPGYSLGFEATLYADLLGAPFEDWPGETQDALERRLDALLAEGGLRVGR